MTIDGMNRTDETHVTVLRLFPVVVLIAMLLIASGLLHLAWLCWNGANWEGPLSLRKPILFGISGGLTVWSIGWVLTRLYPLRYDRTFANLMAWGLLLEVALITIQQWRGVASHFNHATTLDASIEHAMLALITLVTLGVIWLAFRSIYLPAMPAETQIAIRGGLWLLVVSCVLGFVANALGELSSAKGNSPSLLGPAGILKYPHGAALHAIQLLPIIAWLMNRLRVRRAAWQVASVLASQILFLAHAIWQTFHGRSRMDVDWTGCIFLLAAGLTMIPPVVAIIGSLGSINGSKKS
jgi:hypothetical protein